MNDIKLPSDFADYVDAPAPAAPEPKLPSDFAGWLPTGPTMAMPKAAPRVIPIPPPVPAARPPEAAIPQPAVAPLPPTRPADLFEQNVPQPDEAPSTPPAPMPTYDAMGNVTGVNAEAGPSTPPTAPGTPTPPQPEAPNPPGGWLLNKLMGKPDSWNPLRELSPAEGEQAQQDRIDAAQKAYDAAVAAIPKDTTPTEPLPAPQTDLEQRNQDLADIGSRLKGRDAVPAKIAQQRADVASANLDAALNSDTPTMTGAADMAARFAQSISMFPAGIVKPFGQLYADQGQPDLKKAVTSYEKGVQGAFSPDPTQASDFKGKVASAAGAVAPFFAGSAVAKALGISVTGVNAAMGALQGAGSGYEEAEKAQQEEAGKQFAKTTFKLDEDTPENRQAVKDAAKTAMASINSPSAMAKRYLSMFGNAGIGAAQALPFSRLLDRIETMQPGSISNILKSGAQTSLEQTLVQGLSKIGENGIAELLYDKDKALMDGVSDSAAVAAVVGGALGMVGGAIGGHNPIEAPGDPPWHDVLGVAPDATRDEARSAYYAKMKEQHSDTGGPGDRDEMAALTRAWIAAQAARAKPQAPSQETQAPPPGMKVPEDYAGPAPEELTPKAAEAPTATVKQSADAGIKPVEGNQAQSNADFLISRGHDPEDVALRSPAELAADVQDAQEAGTRAKPVATPTVPENADQLKQQQSQALDSEHNRAAVFYPPGTNIPTVMPGLKRAPLMNGQGTVDFNPDKVSHAEVQTAFADGRQNDLLGQKGAPPQDITSDTAVTARDKKTGEVTNALQVNPEHAQAATDALTKAQPDSSIGTESVKDIAAERIGQKPKHTKIGENAEGLPVYEDANGVRSTLENGIRSSEPVRVVPGRGIHVDVAGRSDSYKTLDELPDAPEHAIIEALDPEAKAAVKEAMANVSEEATPAGNAARGDQEAPISRNDSEEGRKPAEGGEVPERRAEPESARPEPKEPEAGAERAEAPAPRSKSVGQTNAHRALLKMAEDENGRVDYLRKLIEGGAGDKALFAAAKDAGWGAGARATHLGVVVEGEGNKVRVGTVNGPMKVMKPAEVDSRLREALEGSAPPDEPTAAAEKVGEEAAASTPAAPPPEHPGLVVKSLETGKETIIQPRGTVAPAKIETPANVTFEHLGKVTEKDAKADLRFRGYEGEFRVIATRQAPWAVGDGFGKTREEAEQNALRRLGIRPGTVPPGPTIAATPSDYVPPLPTSKTPAQAAAEHFLAGNSFRTIVEARKFIREAAGKDLSDKEVEEAIEGGLVQAARSIVAKGQDAPETYRQMVDLYNRQPRLNTRTSKSVAEQAYSTPAPLAYVASRLAGIDAHKAVFEPTAGNGMLLIEADPARTVANEIDPTRRANLEAQGFHPSERDATTLDLPKQFDVVIANPPFGVVRNEGKSTIFRHGAYATTNIDQAISMKSLAAMKDDGRAVLIIGGVNAEDVGERSKGYMGSAKRKFFYNLMKEYNVVDHFTVEGDLYARQGAGWPVDVIVIHGRGASQMKPPSANVPPLLKTWDHVGEKLNDAPSAREPSPEVAGSVGAPSQQAPTGASARGKAGNEGLVRPEAGSSGPVEQPATGEGAKLVPVRGQPDRAEPGNVRAGEPEDGREPVRPAVLRERGRTDQPVDPERNGPLDDFDAAFEEGQAAADREAAPNAADYQKPAPEPTPRSTGEVAKSAAKNAIGSADDALSGLAKLFNSQGRPGSGFTFDEDTWAKAKPLFAKAAEKFGDFLHDMRELVSRMVTEMRKVYGLTREGMEAMKPYLRRFVGEIESGKIKIGEESAVPKKEIAARTDPLGPANEAGQIAYAPASRSGEHLGTLVPANLATPIRDSLNAVERRHGPVDEYVASELGYKPGDLAKHFSAEQIDSIALGLDNIERGSAIILGHQTGIGKGRVVAAMIRYAHKQGMTPVFVTEKPDLYGDMWRDLHDIGFDKALGRPIQMMMTNSGTRVPLDDEAVAWVGEAEEAKANGRDIPKRRGAFTTSQTPAKARERMANVLAWARRNEAPVSEDVLEKGHQLAPPGYVKDASRNIVKAPGDPAATHWKVYGPASGALSVADTKDDALRAYLYGRANPGSGMVDYTGTGGGKVGDQPDVIFTTYDQMNSVKGAETARRNFLRQVSPQSFLIMDEAHNAGGQGESERGEAANKAVPRAKVFREALGTAKAALYSSATWAKTPKVMDLFSRTDMVKAVENPKMLPDLIERGGVPLQQAVSSMLAKSGQYIRNERSFEGVSYDVETAPVDMTAYKRFTSALRTVFEFDKSFEEERNEIMGGMAAELGAGNTRDGGTGEGSANSVAFASMMHNAIGQMISSIKAQAAAERTIQAIKDGEKPVLTFSQTMESFLKDFVEENELKEGDTIALDFGAVLRRYLERTRRVTIKMPDDTVKREMIPLEKMSGGARQAFKAATDHLSKLNFDELPISPIDWIRHKVQEAGHSIREITGRSMMIDYSGGAGGNGEPTLVKRPAGEQGAGGKRVTIKMFNDGKLDAAILNKSGSTGVSMHASNKFPDQRKRRMIIVQADPNIDTHMQMLGRVHRTGQVQTPAYTQLTADIPAEVRPAAVLMKKMASLNANTTAARKSKFTGEAVDFMNEYGDNVVARILQEEPDIALALGDPLPTDDKGRMNSENAAARVTGRLTLLEPDAQQQLIDRISENYTRLIEQLDADGENNLEAKSVDLQARELDSQSIKPPTGVSPFEGEVRLDRMSVKAQGRAMEPKEVMGLLHSVVGKIGDDFTGLKAADPIGRQIMRDRVEDARKKAAAYGYERVAKLKDPDAITKAKAEITDQYRHIHQVASVASPGRVIRIETQEGNIPAVVVDLARIGKGTNPVAPSSWVLSLAVPASQRMIHAPLSQVFVGPKPEGEKGLSINPSSGSDTPQALAQKFEDARKEGRENRYIFSGNILAAYDQTHGQGQILNYTMEDGSQRLGIMMNRGFSSDKFMKDRRVRFKTGDQVRQFLDKVPNGEITSTDGIITVRKAGGLYEFDVPAAKGTGGRYYADQSIRALADHWERKGSRMRVTMASPRAIRMVDAMMKADAVFETASDQAEAEKIVGTAPPQSPKLAAMANAPEESLLPIGSGRPSLIKDQRRRQIIALGKEIVSRVLPHNAVRLEFPRSIENTGFIGSPDIAGASVRGSFTSDPVDDAIQGIIAIATDTGADRNTIYHEAYHAAQRLGLKTPAEERMLSRPENIQIMRAYAVKLFGSEAAQALPTAELEAYSVGDAAQAMDEGKPFTWAEGNIFTRLAGRLLRLLRQLRDAFRGMEREPTFQEFVERFRHGDFADRPIGENQLFERDADGNITVDPVTKSYKLASVGGPEPGKMPYGPRKNPLGKRIRQGITDKLGDLRETLIDFNAPIERMEKLIEERFGANLPADRSLFKAKRLMPGKVAAGQKDIQDTFVRPITKILADNGLGTHDLDNFLLFRHAPERNALMDERNPDNAGRGSGISDEEAEQGMRQLGNQIPILEEAARIHDAMNADAVKRMVSSGLLSQEGADEWGQMFQHYANLKGWEEPDLAPEDAEIGRTGGGKMAVRGPEAKTAFGRRNLSASPTINAIQAAYRTVARAERNRPLKAAWAMFKPIREDIKDIVRLDRAEPKKVLDDATGMMKLVPGNVHGPNSVQFKIGGVPHFMIFKSQRLADSVNRTAPDALPAVLQFINNVNNLKKFFWTHANPNFIAGHFLARYPAEAAFNAFEHGPGAMTRSLRGYPGGPAMRAAWRVEKMSVEDRQGLARAAVADGATEADKWAHYYNEMRNAGGRMDFSSFSDFDTIANKINRDIAHVQGGKIRAAIGYMRDLGALVDKVTTAMDNGNRLAVYRELREKGSSIKDAALGARDATVDFATRGTLTNYASVERAFFNVTVQTGDRTYRGAKRSSRIRKLIAGIVAFGAAQAAWNYLVGGNDDDGKPYFEKLNDYGKETKFILAIPGAKDANGKPYFLAVPFPYGWMPALSIGNMIGSIGMKAAGVAKEDIGSMAARAAHSVIEAFFPLGQEHSWLGTFLPDITHPFLHVATNENTFGSPVHATYPKAGLAHSEQGRPSTPAYWGAFAAALNKISGGDMYHSGYVDLFPEDYREAADAFSGFERMGQKGARAAGDIASGKAPDITDLPIVSQFTMGGTRQFQGADIGAAIERNKQSQRELGALREMRKNDPALAKQYEAEHGGKLQTMKDFQYQDAERRLGQQIAKVRNGALPEAAKQKEIARLQNIQKSRERRHQVEAVH